MPSNRHKNGNVCAILVTIVGSFLTSRVLLRSSLAATAFVISLASCSFPQYSGFGESRQNLDGAVAGETPGAPDVAVTQDAAQNDGPAPTCRDGIQNGTETDLDCGGPVCPPCGAGSKCSAQTDCKDGVCT